MVEQIVPQLSLRFASIVAFITLAAAGCGSPAPAVGQSTTEAAVDGMWRIVSIEIDGLAQVIPENQIELRSDVMGLRGEVGCGGFYGSFSFEFPDDPSGAGFSIPGRTNEPCGDERPQELAISLLEATNSFVLEGNILTLGGTLEGSDVQLQLERS